MDGGRRARRALVLVALLGVAAAACGDDSGDDATSRDQAGAEQPASATAPTSVPEAEDDVDPRGVVRWGADLSGAQTGATMFDPFQSRIRTADLDEQWLIYGSLLRQTPDRELVPELAESATIVDPQTIEVVLREGVVFSDGTPFDAEAVKAGIERNMSAPPPRAQFRAELNDVAAIEVTGPRSLTLRLSRPTAGAVYSLLAGQETFIVSPAAVAAGADLNAEPVGAGPFVLETYEPERRLVYAKNERYWNAADVRLAGIEFVHVPGGPARVNALRSGAVDIVQVSLNDLPALRGSEYEVSAETSESSWLWMPVCKAQPPLSDVRVRRALNMGLDRDAIIASLLEGEGEPAWGLWPEGSPYFHEGLRERYAYDPDQARALLAEAGYGDGFTVTVMPIANDPIAGRWAEVAQAQWRDIGVDVELVPSSNFVNDLYIDNRAQMGALAAAGGGLNQIAGPYRKGSSGNLCQYDNPALNELMARLASVPDGSPEAVQAWKEAQDLVVGEALSIFGAFVPRVFAWDPDVAADVEFVIHAGGISAVPEFTGMYAKMR